MPKMRKKSLMKLLMELYPTEPCQKCGTMNWWWREEDLWGEGEWVCGTCKTKQFERINADCTGAENIEQMRTRHKKEIEQLQDSCPHEHSERMPHMWAPGHFGNDVEVCDFCGKILKTYETSQRFSNK